MQHEKLKVFTHAHRNEGNSYADASNNNVTPATPKRKQATAAKSVIKNFLPRFGHAAEVLYISGVQGVPSFMDEKRLLELGLSELPHDKLPEIIAYSQEKNWLYFIKTVRSENPITKQSLRTFERITERCTAKIVYVSAFLSRSAFRKFACDIAWNTQVWTADAPEHTVHFAANESLECMFVHPPAQERRNMPL